MEGVGQSHLGFAWGVGGGGDGGHRAAWRQWTPEVTGPDRSGGGGKSTVVAGRLCAPSTERLSEM